MFRRKRRLPIGGLLLAACLAALLWLTVRSAAGWLGGGVDSGAPAKSCRISTRWSGRATSEGPGNCSTLR